MSWFAENWIWVLFGVAFIGMHLFGHGGHGGRGGGCGHGGHGAGSGRNADAEKTAAKQAKGTPRGAKGGSRTSHRN